MCAKSVRTANMAELSQNHGLSVTVAFPFVVYSVLSHTADDTLLDFPAEFVVFAPTDDEASGVLNITPSVLFFAQLFC